MKLIFRTFYGMAVMVILFLLAITPIRSKAAVAGEAIAAGGRAMATLDGAHRAWITTLPPADQQRVLCAVLEREGDRAGLDALECSRVGASLTPAKVAQMGESWERYQAGFGYAYPTGNDMSRVAPVDRESVYHAMACQRIRDRIAIQADLMSRGSTGYWNMDQMRVVERQQCVENMAVVP